MFDQSDGRDPGRRDQGMRDAGAEPPGMPPLPAYDLSAPYDAPSSYHAAGPAGPGRPLPPDRAYGASPMPMQPGVVPLRPLTLGDLYSGAFATMRSNPRTMLGVPLVVFAVPALISFVVAVVYQRIDMAGPGAFSVNSLIGDNVSQVFTGIASFVLGGFLIAPVRAAVVGHRMSPGEAGRIVLHRLPHLIGFALLCWTALVLVFVAFVLLAVVGVVPLLDGADGDGDTQAVSRLLLLVATAFVVFLVVLVLSVLLVFAPAAIVLENAGVFRSFARSARLVQGSFWRILGIVMLTGLITSIASLVLLGPVGIIATAVGAGVFGASPLAVIATAALSAIGLVLAYGITQPFSAAVTSLLYLDRRMRTEGYALDLLREAQQRSDIHPAGR